MKKIIIALLIMFGLIACEYTPGYNVLSPSESPVISSQEPNESPVISSQEPNEPPVISSQEPNEPPVISSQKPNEKVEPNINWENFEIHSVYLSSIYSSMVFGADGDYLMIDGWVYVKDTLLTRMRPDGSEKELLPADVNRFNLYNATYHDGWIYFIGERYMYLGTLPPPGTNEHLLRMRPDGTDLQECVKNVFGFEIYGDWIFYQFGYSLFTVKIGEWSNSYVLYKNTSEKQDTWLLRNWIIYGDYVFFSINETRGGEGQYNTKMYRMNLNGTDKILLKESTIISYHSAYMKNILVDSYSPRFVYDGYLYFSCYQFGVGDIIYRMDLDGTNIKTIIKPTNYVLLRKLLIKENWLYYEYSWRDNSKPYSQNLTESIRKVRLDGTDDRLANWNVFGGGSESISIWPKGNIVMWQRTSWVTSGRITRQFLYIAPINQIEDVKLIFDGNGWESPMGHFIWNGNIYIFVKSWR